MFGIVEHGNGTKSRKNSILLSILKDRNLLKRHIAYKQANGFKDSALATGFDWLENCTIQSSIISSIEYYLTGYNYGAYDCKLNGILYRSSKYKTDDSCGVCLDGDAKCIRYINTESGKVYKMKAGKFIRHIIEENPQTNILPEAAKVYFCEEFTRNWLAYAAGKCTGEYKLNVDDNFADIYNSDRCPGNFGSCMVDDGFFRFYENSVTAKAAYLTNAADEITARCILFTEVTDQETGEVVRLAERQYSKNGDDVLKKLLVDKLIQAGEIDGYKKIGAGCGDSTAFVSNTGEDWSNRKFKIKCYLEPGDVLSYQDSFKYFNYSGQEADNWSGCGDDLSETSGTYNGGTYCEHRDEYYPEEDTRYCENTGTDEYIDDCIMIGNSWYYAGYNCEDPGYWNIYKCPECGDWFCTDDNIIYSELTGDYYCCSSCMESAEDDYKSSNWYYSDYDGEYFEDESDVETVFEIRDSYNGVNYSQEITIHQESLQSLIDEDRAYYCEEKNMYIISHDYHDTGEDIKKKLENYLYPIFADAV